MNLYILAILLSIILSLQSLTVSTALAVNSTTLLNQYGSVQTTTYPNVDLQWAPTKPTAGQDVTFNIAFRNPGSSMPKSHIDYTFTISKEGDTVYTVSKHTHSGTDKIKQTLPTDGIYKITVTITGIDFNDVQPRSSDFSITVEKPPMQEQPQKQPPQQQPKEKAKEEPKKPVKEEQKSMKAEKNSGERHSEHLAKHTPIVGPYEANLNYTLTAIGRAISISDNSTSEDATVSMNLSVWKSTRGLVGMDVMSGMIKIGNNETYDINSGIALYLINAHKMIVIGHIQDGKEVRLMVTLPKDAELAAEKSQPAQQLEVLSPQSKLVSKWFLNMHGEIKLS